MGIRGVNFLLAGVGGQGVIFAGDLLSEVGVAGGYDVKKSEVHGMAQRGGIVESHVRWGRLVHSPLIPKGGADYLVGFELLEAARWGEFLSPNGCAIVSDLRISPAGTRKEGTRYPTKEEVKRLLSSYTPRVYLLSTATIAKEMGHLALVGVMMMGVLARTVEREQEGPDAAVWLDVLRTLAPGGLVEKNVAAFMNGWTMAHVSGGELERWA